MRVALWTGINCLFTATAAAAVVYALRIPVLEVRGQAAELRQRLGTLATVTDILSERQKTSFAALQDVATACRRIGDHDEPAKREAAVAARRESAEKAPGGDPLQLQRALDLVAKATMRGQWDEDDREQLRLIARDLDDEQKMQVFSTLNMAVNEQRVRPVLPVF